MKRRELLKAAGSTLILFGTGVLLQDSELPHPQIPKYVEFKSKLEDALNLGQVNEAKYLLEHSYKIEVPVHISVLEQVAAAFTHRHETSFLLFADSADRIHAAVRPDEIAVNTPEKSAVRIGFSIENIAYLEARYGLLIGDYHSHRRTKEDVSKLLADQQVQIQELIKINPSALYKLYDNTAPSEGDREDIEVCDTAEACAAIKKLTKQKRVHLIGGVNQKGQFHTRAFSFLSNSKGPILDLTLSGREQWSELQKGYFASRNPWILESVEFTIRPYQ